MNAARDACRVNGEPGTVAGIDDRGLRYGDGVFETLAIVGHQPQLWTRHLDRLETGCRRLGLPVPSRGRWQADLAALALPRFGTLRLTVTRGEGGRGYAPPTAPQTTTITQCGAVPERPDDWWQTGVAVRFCETRLAVQPALAGIKHLNRLEQVLARGEWSDPGTAEGVMEAMDGRIIEATSSNLIIDQGDHLCAPATDDCGVDGVMQGWLLDRAAASGASVKRTAVRRADLWQARGVMLVNSLVGLWPVRTLAGHPLPRSPWADRLQDELVRAGTALLPAVVRS
ncbi:aminodeoxychorismate lyase [Spiribacter aquaticus]|uniref:Aminodeoxychorismate lyase n=1 Tax=Spiribacter aquaticus TaxID=1935996 RepID=A0A557RJ28_9GAMM|nr:MULTISPECIES: aminodeoxychorismate lyase [Spiribacter]KAF0280294.1 aminodeoxychorismate lyase [Spiribacter roseus]TVO65171.1 aminodeoxychorismate lyase [Spiribacter aquaticus]